MQGAGWGWGSHSHVLRNAGPRPQLQRVTCGPHGSSLTWMALGPCWASGATTRPPVPLHSGAVSSGGGAQHGPPALNTSGCGPWISSSIGSIGSTGHCSREPCRAALWPSPPRATGPGTPPVIFLLQVRLVLPGATLPHLTIHAVHGDTGPLCHCHDCWGAAAPPVTGPSRPWPRRWRPLMGHVWHRRPGTLCTWWWGQ